ncbi:hypothetical protein D3C87_1432790 [compost metagenome]
MKAMRSGRLPLSRNISQACHSASKPLVKPTAASTTEVKPRAKHSRATSRSDAASSAAEGRGTAA